MKKRSILCAIIPFLAVGIANAQPTYQFAEAGTKNFITETTIEVGDQISLDLYLSNVSVPQNAGGAWIDFTASTTRISYVSGGRCLAGGAEGCIGPWQDNSGVFINEPDGAATDLYLILNLSGAAPDGNGDLILGTLTLECISFGDATVDLTTIPGFETWTPINDAYVLPGSLRIHQVQKTCTVDADCDDSLFCTGVDMCVGGFCQADISVDCEDGLDCNNGPCQQGEICNEDTDTCDTPPCEVTLVPPTISLFPHEEFQFITTTEGICNEPCYTWEITEMGSVGSIIDDNGLYRAGTDAGTDVVMITDPCNGDIFDSAIINVMSPPSTTVVQKAIIVAGGGPYPGNNLWDVTQMLTNYAYRTLTYQGFAGEDIFYLSADTDLDLNGDGIPDVDRTTSNDNLEYAITEWAMEEGTDSLVLYFTGHGGPDVFRMNETEILSSPDLTNWLKDFQGNSPDQKKIIVIYDASESGSFIDDLGGNDRIIVTSTSPGEQAIFLNQGIISFSYYFWTDIFYGLSVSEAFIHASHDIKLAFNSQNPQISGLAENVYIGGIQNISGYQFEQMWPTLRQPWYFVSLSSITTDATGNIYVMDSDNLRIQKFSSDGFFISTWGWVKEGTGDGELNRPNGIFIDDNNGYIYVADTWNHRIQKFTQDGVFITMWGSYGSGDGEFNNPNGIVIDSAGYFYIVDTGNNRIQKFTADGQFITTLGKDLNHPSEVALDIAGNIYIVDTWNNRIQKCRQDGNCVSWGELGSLNGQFKTPQGIAIDDNGFVYVADTGNDRIQKFTSEGTWISTWQFDESPIDTTTSPDGYIYAISPVNIHKLNPAGILLSTWGSSGKGNGEFSSPLGITLDAVGSIYVADTRNNRIQKSTPDNKFTQWGEGNFNNPSGIIFSSTGYVYVADTGNRQIKKFASDGRLDQQWDTGDDFEPIGIAVDANENIYISVINLSSYAYSVLKLMPDSGSFSPWGNGLRSPYGIAVDEDGYVYVTEPFEGLIKKLQPDGTLLETWGGENGVEFLRPKGITISAQGYIYVADTGNNLIKQLDAEGNLISLWGDYGITPGQMYSPHDIAVGPDLKVYITDTGLNRIQVFRTSAFVPFNQIAIVVAGGGPYDGNHLWDETRYIANLGYSVLISQGFQKEDIFYLTYRTQEGHIDLDGDLNDDKIWDDEGVLRNTIKSQNLQYAITDWAVKKDPESLVIYMVDHGLDNLFQMNGVVGPGDAEDWLSASVLSTWLNEFQEKTSSQIILIYDACNAGSFLDDLSGDNRVIITSTEPNQNSTFMPGNISFSYYFWTAILNGRSIQDAFIEASDNISPFQNPLISGYADNSYILGYGNEKLGGSPPSISAYLEIGEDLTSAVLYAENVIDPEGDPIARVWAVIIPPNFDLGSPDIPIIDQLPSIELMDVSGDSRYVGIYDGFNQDGIYNISVYVMDTYGNTSSPAVATVTGNYDRITKKAIIMAGDESITTKTTIIKANAEFAYNALRRQGYNHDDICFLGNSEIPWTDDVPTNLKFENHLNKLAADNSIEYLDLVIYFIGAGNFGTFHLNPTEKLKASDLVLWLENLQKIKPSRVTFIYDADYSGSFTPALAIQERERILITSTDQYSSAYFNNVSFSYFFWNQISLGVEIGPAFGHAKKAISYLNRKNGIAFSCYKNQIPLLDADGDGLSNESSDYNTAMNLVIGTGEKHADDFPLQIELVSVEKDVDRVTIFANVIANDITANKIQRVWALIKPIGYCPGNSDKEIAELPEIDLYDDDGDRIYEGIYYNPIDCYKINVYAMDVDDNVSLPKETKFYQTEGQDIYEVDDYHTQANVIVVNHPTPQPHNFHYTADEDWVKFYCLKGINYVVKANNLGTDCIPVIELYQEDVSSPIAIEDIILDNSVSIGFVSDQDGIYYVKLYNRTEGENTEYDLTVYDGYWGLTAIVAGKVKDRLSRRPIDGAVIRSTGVGATISTHGEYLLSEIPGNWKMTARKNGYTNSSAGISIASVDQYIRKDINMSPLSRSSCAANADCDDGDFCSGSEICVKGTCQPGIEPCPDDGKFCNGTEGCDEENDTCTHTGSPCPGHLDCVEENDQCVAIECPSDQECDDSEFCNGAETCLEGICQEGINPCADPTPACDEESDLCIEGPSIQLLPNPYMQSRWMPMLLLLRIVGANTHFDGSSRVTFDPPGAAMALPILGDDKHLLMIGLLMPSWLSSVKSLNVTVTTGTEVVSEELNLEFPFMMKEQTEKLTDRTP